MIEIDHEIILIIDSLEIGYGDRHELFEQSQDMVRHFISNDYSELTHENPMIDLFRRGIIQSVENYFLSLLYSKIQPGRFSISPHDILLRSLRQCLPYYHEQQTFFCPQQHDLSFPPERHHVLVLDVNRTYSASMIGVINRFLSNGGFLNRLRFPYGSTAPPEHSPLCGSLSTSIWPANLLQPGDIRIKTLVNRYCQELMHLHEFNCSSNKVVKLIISHLVNSNHAFYAAALRSIVAMVDKYLQPKIIAMADDTWPEGRTFAKHSEIHNIKYQDGVQVRDLSGADCVCDYYCVWSGTDAQFAIDYYDVPPEKIIVNSSNKFFNISRHGLVSNGKIIIYASRPNSRDLGLSEKLKIIRCLIEFAKENPNLLIWNKLHPSESSHHFNDLMDDLPLNFQIVSGATPFNQVVQKASLLLAGNSVTILEAVEAGVPVGRINLGPKPDTGSFPVDVFPVLGSWNDFLEVIVDIESIQKVFLEKQKRFVKEILHSGDDNWCFLSHLVPMNLSTAMRRDNCKGAEGRQQSILNPGVPIISEPDVGKRGERPGSRSPWKK